MRYVRIEAIESGFDLDAVGAGAAYSGIFPVSASGHIWSAGNFGTDIDVDGDRMVIAQMYEKKASDPWDSYVLPD